MKKSWGGTILFLSVVILAFHNCSGFAPTAGSLEQASSMDLPYGDPGVNINSAGTATTGQIVMGDRIYLQSVFNDIFNIPGASPNAQAYFQAVVLQEFAPEQQMLGRSCDPVQDGTAVDCNYDLSNVETAMNATSSAIREAARIQVCRRLLANDEILGNVVAGIKGDQDTPNAQSVTAAIQLFFPAQASALSVVPSLLQMDLQMAAQTETVNDRWRAILLTLCESPAWQVL